MAVDRPHPCGYAREARTGSKEHPERPEGCTEPLYKAHREAEMSAAHAYFSTRLQQAVGAGKRTPHAT
ncbi:hypothetical protein SSP531S_51930 [Streptomyces spongiicola]|uniref:Uncharacterized protein n=1 Tax=Streptomyces spongiicola TaxID=1690221 RepID=A0A388T450_9ACTN|nr:hypothetical protein [Streptomyces spongiicola]GBQ03718.1 hypothetical protein SSP531S_51930 [Streptomyces spongiicola]